MEDDADRGGPLDSATQLQNWKLADKSRRLLADLSNYLSEKMPPAADRPLEEMDKEDLRKAALISASAIIVRAVGSGMNLVACGYLPESAGPAPRALEAKLHARAVSDDRGLALYPLAYEAVEMCAVLAEPFDLAFEVPPRVSNELRTQGGAFRNEHESN